MNPYLRGDFHYLRILEATITDLAEEMNTKIEQFLTALKVPGCELK